MTTLTTGMSKSGRVRSTAITRSTPIARNRSSSHRRSAVNVISLEMRDVTKRASVGCVRDRVEQGRAQFIFSRFRIIRKIVPNASDVSEARLRRLGHRTRERDAPIGMATRASKPSQSARRVIRRGRDVANERRDS